MRGACFIGVGMRDALHGGVGFWTVAVDEVVGFGVICAMSEVWGGGIEALGH